MFTLDMPDRPGGAQPRIALHAPSPLEVGAPCIVPALRVPVELSARTVPRFCRAVEALFATHQALTIDLGEVKSVDVVGLAALLQASERAAARNIALSIWPGPAVHAAALRAKLMDELPFVTALIPAEYEWTEIGAASPDEPAPMLARTARIGLRPATWEELELFGRWATDPLLEQMVGSELLYQVRHLGPYHPDTVGLILNDPTSLTLVVEPLAPLRAPVGFVRLYQIDLTQQFAFLETAVASVESVRRGWGVEASRIFMAYALDVLRLHRVEAKVYSYNVLSANSLKRSGCRLEGVLRQARVYGGQRWDIHIYGILEEEMSAQRRAERYPNFGLWSEAC
jgi:RimJ/RimL family protein N-acetyltransferase/ABC-type transporter Mla MlaB component